MTDDSHGGRIPAEDRESGADKVYIEAELVADTRTSEQQLGFRNVGARERRMLYQAEDTYVELLVPHTEGAVLFTIGDRENQQAWEDLFDDLKTRGVKEVGLWITDGEAEPALLGFRD